MAAWLATTLVRGAGGPDGVDLEVDEGPGQFDVTLEWTGGQPNFEVFRSPTPDDVADPLNSLGETVVRDWVDTTPPGDLYFYYVRSPCVIDPPERCDGVEVLKDDQPGVDDSFEVVVEGWLMEARFAITGS